MDDKNLDSSKSLGNEINIDTNISKIKTNDVEITMHIKKLKNPAELLEKLYLIRNNATLNNEEKNKEVKKIMNDYMR